MTLTNCGARYDKQVPNHSLRAAYDLCEPLQSLAQGRSLGADIAACIEGL